MPTLLRSLIQPYFLCLCIALLGSAALPLQAAGPAISPPIERKIVDSRFVQYTLPAGTAFQVLLQTPINSSINQLNDPVEVIMAHNLYLYETLILPINTRFKGTVTQVEPPIQGRNAMLTIRFNDIILKNGEKLPIQAHVRTERNDHGWGGEVTPGTKPIRSTQRVLDIGEYNRIVMAGPRAMGQDILFTPGEHWIIILEQPLTLLQPKPTEHSNNWH